MQTTSSVIMVPPTDFCFNEQTGSDNVFQNVPTLSPEIIREDALCEFSEMVNLLRDQHIEVLLLNKTDYSVDLPDAVFPNNWFSTAANGTITLYPMKTENRQAEVRPAELEALLERNHYSVKQVEDLRTVGSQALEGTGSIIFDHERRIAYAARSERCDEALFNQYCQDSQYTPVLFSASSNDGTPYYHTNIMMSVGSSFAVVCLEVIKDEAERTLVRENLQRSHKQIIEISAEQVEQGFCGNILQLHNNRNQSVIVMSVTAWENFDESQQDILKSHGTVVPCPIPTIESVGGGSARCMIAENFLPKQR